MKQVGETTDSYTLAATPKFESILRVPSIIYSSFENRSKNNLDIDEKTQHRGRKVQCKNIYLVNCPLVMMQFRSNSFQWVCDDFNWLSLHYCGGCSE
ncbi:hypothetical protein AAZX31_11G024300 [Glycine max]|uniref:uncharacterized protein LOC114373797 isoform X2 n=1 Tax=Glycine soja TaxID=3848 RepID=UPI000295E5DC|nr:uncharacterized protein LOC114373797 isoform X2 [Glycine soja]XP_040862491.1 uncharacterized protein LOC121173014 isoform X2 [Glycine max]